MPDVSPEEMARQETERLVRISELEQQIEELELSCDEYDEISLLGVEVTSLVYGVGTVIDQAVNKIKVKFSNIEKTFILDSKYAARPRFEDDEDIVSAFTEYGRIRERLKKLKQELAALQV